VGVSAKSYWSNCLLKSVRWQEISREDGQKRVGRCRECRVVSRPRAVRSLPLALSVCESNFKLHTLGKKLCRHRMWKMKHYCYFFKWCHKSKKRFFIRYAIGLQLKQKNFEGYENTHEQTIGYTCFCKKGTKWTHTGEVVFIRLFYSARFIPC
jgi:hypothetical protein